MNETRRPQRPFEFLSAGRIVFGSGSATSLGERAARFGRRALLVTGKNAERTQVVRAVLEAAGIECAAVSVAAEPCVADALAAVELGRAHGVELVVACGGGSVIDLGKAAAALLTNLQDPFEYLEVVGRGLPLVRPALPVVALPTTAGTGAEVTKNAVLASPEHQVKASLRHDSMLPAVAIVDPELTLSVPAAVTAATGLDALTQCLEPFVSCLSNPLTDAIALEGLRRGARALPLAFRNGSDLAAREDMALCSLFGGLSLANAKLGAVHGFAAPIGGQFDAPHGAVCARLLPLVMRANIAALRERQPKSPLLARFDVVAQALTGQPQAKAADGIAFVQALADELAVPGLASYGVTAAHIPDLVTKAAAASSMKGNPLPLTPAELSAILEQAL
ncbi:MAG TPA: iron-containing alcohol dehydrogenase [Polyangiaceae bacterium]|nr:iron-containing alcohol dehydrogenase [Polyangiaceae bacterium]